MGRFLAAASAACWVIGVTQAPATLAAQVWNDERTTSLVKRGVAVRQRELADTALTDYQARAHGYLTFLAQLGGDPAAGGDPFTEPPRVVKSDELELEVYWRAPASSKQRIVGRRDTLLLPTDINYHRDHLGIVQNNFPGVIRLGEGDEVRDVPHPLSDAGLAAYDFAVTDSLRIRLPDRDIEVYEIRVRPKNDALPRLVGAIYLERGSARVVRMAFNFTRAAYLDAQLEDIAVVLENGLVEGRFWLPWRQEIEIRRSGTWLDYPARGIIRGRWEVCCYAVNRGLDPTLFAGPEIVLAPPEVLRAHQWQGAVLDALPGGVRAFTDADVQRVQEDARALVRAQALARARGATLSARGVSDFARVDRVEGFAPGAGFRQRLGDGLSLAAGGRWGLDDRRAKGTLSAGWQRGSGAGAELLVRRDFRDAGDVREMSGLANSLAAQEFGSDRSDPYDVRGAGIRLTSGAMRGVRWSLEAARESQGPLSVHAAPATGRYKATIPAWRVHETRLSLRGQRGAWEGPLGVTWRLEGEARYGWFAGRDTAFADQRPAFARMTLQARGERRIGRRSLVFESFGGAARGRGELPPQEFVFLGGPVTAPGYAFHSLVGRTAATQRIEWRVPVPWVAVPLGRFGRAPGSATMAPFAHVAWVGGKPRPGAPAQNGSGWYPSAGLGLIALFDLLRLDVARGLHRGRWTLSLDVGRELWGIL
jgi:hypothetical protein